MQPPMETLSLSKLPKIDLSKWKEKFSKLVEETPYRPKVAAARPAMQNARTSEMLERAVPTTHSELNAEQVLERWGRFIEELERTGRSRLASHLRMCRIEHAGGVVLALHCPSRIAFETLLDEMPMLYEAAKAFYGASIAFEVLLDKAAMQARKEERTVEERFKELAEKNELVRYLIEQFGAELSY